MRTVTKRASALVLAGMLVGASAAVSGAQPVDVKASRKCRNTIGAKSAALIKTALKVVDTCHKNRAKGKPTGDCNVLDEADVKGKFDAGLLKAAIAIDKQCVAGDPVLLNYPGGDVDATLGPIIRNAIESSSAALQGSLDLLEDKAKIKCHGSIGKARSGVVNEVVKSSTKCQKTADKAASVFEELLGSCLASPVKSEPKGEAGITKKCGALGGSDVGSCVALPGCVSDAATETAQLLAAAIYGVSPCGNGMTDPGEICDDGNLTDGDGCDSNCTPTGCGNGIATTGEQCDDGNALTTDACISCQDAVCGDGFIRTGVEVCGDAPPTACEDPSPATCEVSPCSTVATMRVVSVSFAPASGTSIGGLGIRLDYPEGKVQVPGTLSSPDVRDRITTVPSGLGTELDRDYEVEVSLTSTEAIAAGVLFTVNFDDCESVPAPTLDEFACIVTGASDPEGMPVAGTTCSVSIP